MASHSDADSSDSSDSDLEILHELCNNVNLGLAKASSVESYKSSLSAITTGKYIEGYVNSFSQESL